MTALLLLARDGALSLDDPIGTNVPRTARRTATSITLDPARRNGKAASRATPESCAFVEEFIDRGRLEGKRSCGPTRRSWHYAIPAWPVIEREARRYDCGDTNTILIGIGSSRRSRSHRSPGMNFARRGYSSRGARVGFGSIVERSWPWCPRTAAQRQSLRRIAAALFPFWDPRGIRRRSGGAGSRSSTSVCGSKQRHSQPAHTTLPLRFRLVPADSDGPVV